MFNDINKIIIKKINLKNIKIKRFNYHFFIYENNLKEFKGNKIGDKRERISRTNG